MVHIRTYVQYKFKVQVMCLRLYKYVIIIDVLSQQKTKMSNPVLASSVFILLTICPLIRGDDLIPDPKKAFSPLDFLGPIQPGEP